MNAKEKARELVDKFSQITRNEDFDNTKQCAIIAVDEILEIYRKNWGIENSEWLEVRNEIEKL